MVRTWVQNKQRPEFPSIVGESPYVKFLWGQFPSLEIQGGLLIRRLKTSHLPDRRQVLLPKGLRNEALKMTHEARTGGHLGVSRTVASLRRCFLWPQMKHEARRHVAACDACAKQKTTQGKRRAPLHGFHVGTPLERVAIDIVGPFPLTENGNRYILVVTDCFTKWVEAFPMPNQESVTVAEAMEGFYTGLGLPTFLHSDQGAQFEAHLFQEMCRLLGIKKTRTTPYHPQSDGQSERNIKTLTKMLATVTGKQDEWDKHLKTTMMAYRATPHESTGFTPNMLMLGREIALPTDIMCGLPPDSPREVTSYVADLRDRLEEAHRLARRHLRQATCRQKRYYDNKVRGTPFQVGDLCWVANKAHKKGISPKLQDKWKGPGLVTRVYGDVTVEVQLGAAKFVTVHTDMLKESQSPKRPSWMRAALQSLHLAQAEEERAKQPQEVATQTDPPPTPIDTPDDPAKGPPAVGALPRPTETEQEDTPVTGSTAPLVPREGPCAPPGDNRPAGPPRPVPAPRRSLKRPVTPQDTDSTGSDPPGATIEDRPVPAPQRFLKAKPPPTDQPAAPSQLPAWALDPVLLGKHAAANPELLAAAGLALVGKGPEMATAAPVAALPPWEYTHMGRPQLAY